MPIRGIVAALLPLATRATAVALVDQSFASAAATIDRLVHRSRTFILTGESRRRHEHQASYPPNPAMPANRPLVGSGMAQTTPLPWLKPCQPHGSKRCPFTRLATFVNRDRTQVRILRWDHGGLTIGKKSERRA